MVCLALGGLPVAAQEASSSPSAPGEFSQVHSLPGGGTCTPVNQDWPMELACTELTNDLRVNGQATRMLDMGPLSPTDSLDGLFWWDVIIHGPDGDWTGPGYGVRDTDGTVHGVEMLTGQGAYAGLVYAASVTTPMGYTGTTSGFIAEGAVPPDLRVVSPPPSPSPAPSLATIGLPADDGARIVAVEELDTRTRDLTIESPSVGHGEGAPAPAVGVRGRAGDPLAGPLPAAGLLRHLRQLDPRDRRRGAHGTHGPARRHARRHSCGGWRVRLVHRLVQLRRGRSTGLGDVPPHRAAPAARAQLAGGRRPRHRRALDGWPGCHDLRGAPPRHVQGGGLVQRRAAHPGVRR